MAENPPETASSSSQPSSSSQKSPQEDSPQVPAFSNFPPFPGGYYQMFPGMYPALVPVPQNDEHANRGAGIYAVPVHHFDRHVTGLSYNTLIPLTYRTPTNRPSSEAAAASENQGQAAQQQQPQQPGPQRYQTGALTPIIRWLSQGMQRAAAPPHPPRPAARAENVPAARPEGDNAAPAEGQPEVDGNQPANDADREVENENVAEPGRGNGGNQWWGIVKEIQMIVFGFITSLLPGFHNHMD
ncbi:protein transport protein SEC31 isoform X3 [Abrus precatorius]|uniref:Protein transport protein SEC31 isoform X3 n=1 Tax=Abrus precatorius TaxID=3816 RepID=A0A8B8JMS7_ABRPR|nr:protein transport protein SEC31 isoform X3 [Abrus precatorius]